MHEYRSLAGTLMYMRSGVLPQAIFVTSKMQQNIPRLSDQDLANANNILIKLRMLDPNVTFLKAMNISSFTIQTFSDASHPENTCYGQTGMISGLRIIQQDGMEIFHTVHWASQKQKRVNYSAYGQEILAVAYEDDRGYYFKCVPNSIFL